MNEIISGLMQQARQTTEFETANYLGPDWLLQAYTKNFSDLLLKDILQVVKAQAMFNETADEVYENITRVYR